MCVKYKVGDNKSFWYLALIQNDNPRVLVVLLLDFVFRIYAGPLHLKTNSKHVEFVHALLQALPAAFDERCFHQNKQENLWRVQSDSPPNCWGWGGTSDSVGQPVAGLRLGQELGPRRVSEL